MSSQFIDQAVTLSTGVAVPFSSSRINTRAILCQSDAGNANPITIKNVNTAGTIRVLQPGESFTIIPDNMSLEQGHQLNVADYSATGTTGESLWVSPESLSVV